MGHATASSQQPESLAIDCRRITKSFGSIAVLRGIDLQVRSGTIFGLLGANGAGKTTLIRILLGLSTPDAGEGSVLGQPIPPRSVLHQIGYMPQRLAIYPDLTVTQNLTLFGQLAGLDDGTIAARTDEVLRVVDLRARAQSVVMDLSGGLQRRASLAMALLSAPRLLVLDEPTVGVDPELRLAFWDHFRTLADAGTTVLITTHYLDEASRCDTIAFLHDGAILHQGTPTQVRAHTATGNLEDSFLQLVRRQRSAPAAASEEGA